MKAGRTSFLVDDVARLDGLVVRSRKRPRAYKRKFPHEEARRLRASGLTYVEIARHFGVSDTAVMLACDPVQRRRYYERSREYLMGGTCIDCGGRCTLKGQRCRSCYTRLKVESAPSVRPTTLRCAVCRQWKSDSEFSPESLRPNPARRGRRGLCRSCDTAARRRYRERHKVPCRGGCGRMVEGKGRASRSTGYCSSCVRLRAKAESG
jgi:hypothetical protein